MTAATARACRRVRGRARRRRSRGTRRSSRPSTAAARALFGLARLDQRVACRRWASHVPLAPSVQMHRCTVGAGVGPLRERGAASELDVVGVRADRQHARRDAAVERGHGRGLGVSRRARSSGTSTSKPSAGSRTTRTSSPARSAAATCRANEPGPYANSNGASTGTRAHRRAVAAMVGHEHRDRSRRRRRRLRRATSRTAGRRARRRHARGHGRGPMRARRRPRHRAIRDPPTVRAHGVSHHAATSGALDTTTTSRAPAAATTASAMRCASATRASSSRTRARRAFPKRKERRGTTIPAAVEVVYGASCCEGCLRMTCVCYRPWMPSIPARRASSTPACATGCGGPSKAKTGSRATGR